MIIFNDIEFKLLRVRDKQYPTFMKYIDSEHTELIGVCRPDKTTTTYICLLKCKVTGNYYTKTQNAMRKNKACPFCKESALEKFMTKLEGKGYHTCPDTEYINNSTKIKLQHSCGRICEFRPSDLLNGRSKCPCQRNMMDRKQVDQLLEKHGMVLMNGQDKLYGVTERIEILHVKCGRSISTSLINFKTSRTKYRCKFCFGTSQAKKHASFIEELETTSDGTIITEGLYVSNSTSMMFNCTICQTEWMSTPERILTGRSRCSRCSLKHMTAMKIHEIITYLEAREIKYLSEYRYDDCRYKRPLPFDFKVGDLLIEFDNEQHFHQSMFNRRDKGKQLATRQLINCIKARYCIDHGLTLVRIPYHITTPIERVLTAILKGDLSNEELFVIQSGVTLNIPDNYHYLFDNELVDESRIFL